MSSLIPTKLPKTIYQVWFQGESHLSTKPRYFQNVQNWKLLNPSWRHVLLDEKDLRNICMQVSLECLQAFDNMQFMHQKIDFGRYAVLYLYGGMYCDVDMYALRSLDNSVPVSKLFHDVQQNKHVLGVSFLSLDPFESILFSGADKVFNNAVMFSTSRNPFLKELINNIIQRTNETSTFSNQFIKVHATTGPHHFNQLLQRHIRSNSPVRVHAFNPEVFEPGPPMGHFNITDETLAIHKMDMSWVPDNIKVLIQTYYTLKPYLVPIVALLIVYILTRRRSL